MAIRAILDGDGLLISQPGIDVPDASASQLLFNSQWSSFGLFLQGTHQVIWPSVALGDRTGSYSHDVNYGMVFSSPPIVIVEIYLNGTWRMLGGSGGSGNANLRREIRIYTQPGNIWSRTAFYNFGAVTEVDRLRILGNFDVGGTFAQPRFQPPNLDIRYTVFTYNF